MSQPNKHQFITGKRFEDRVFFTPPWDDGFGDEEFAARQRDETRVKARTLLLEKVVVGRGPPPASQAPPGCAWAAGLAGRQLLQPSASSLEVQRCDSPRIADINFPDWSRQEPCGAVADDPSPHAGPQPDELPAGQYLLCSCGRSRHG